MKLSLHKFLKYWDLHRPFASKRNSANGNLLKSFVAYVKPEIGDHLYYFDLETLNQAISKARAFEGKLQLRRLRVQQSH